MKERKLLIKSGKDHINFINQIELLCESPFLKTICKSGIMTCEDRGMVLPKNGT